MASKVRDSLQEGRAWHEASDEAWAGYAVAVYTAAVARREREAGGEGGGGSRRSARGGNS